MEVEIDKEVPATADQLREEYAAGLDSIDEGDCDAA